MKYSIPPYVLEISQSLQKAGFEAYLVGGCVRDILIQNRKPKDWDLTTNALPKQIQEIFPDSFYENDFGTVGVKVAEYPGEDTKHQKENASTSNTNNKKYTQSYVSGDPSSTIQIVEVTTYRTESGYSDNRRPDEIRFAKTLDEDLQRRDFTMNAIALHLENKRNTKSHNTEHQNSNQISGVKENTDSSGHHTFGNSPFVIRDPFDGQKDIQNKLIRAVGDPNERFGEDALRMMRAVRLASELDFSIEENTLKAIQKNASRLKTIARERVRIELERIILSDSPAQGIAMLEKTHLLQYILPELREGIGVTQNLHHTYTVWEHNLKALATCPSEKLSVRLATLLHDVGKPRTKRGDGKYATFYNHDHVGARMTRAILSRLTFPKEIIDHATLLVDNHLFYYNVDEVTESAVRRVIARVGKENIKDLIDVRIGDRLGSGVPKAKPYRLRHFEYMVEKVSHDPLSTKELKINGKDLLRELSLKPGPKIGAILDVLLGEVIENTSLNAREALITRAKELDKEDLGSLRSTAKKRIEEQRKADEENMKKRYWVK